MIKEIPKQQESWPDLIRASAILLVVGVHVSGAILNDGFNASGIFGYWFAVFVNALGRSGVPLFFMLSGALLIGKKIDLSPIEFLKKRLSRVGVAALFWSIFYCCIILIRKQSNDPLALFCSILYKPAYYHLWYFYSIIGLYLFTPLLQSANRNILWYITALWLVGTVVCYIPDRFLSFTINGNLTHIIPIFIGFFTLGALLRTWVLSGKHASIALWVFAGSLLFTIFGYGSAMAFSHSVASLYFFNYVSVNVVVQSVALFLLLRFSSDLLSHKYSISLISWLSANSLGIFVLHPLILEWFKSGFWFGIKLSAYYNSSFVGIPLTILATVGLCGGITGILKLIPFVKRCV